MLAADTLVYLGDLRQVFTGAAGRLAPDGHFLFTVENKDGEGFLRSVPSGAGAIASGISARDGPARRTSKSPDWSPRLPNRSGRASKKSKESPLALCFP